MSGLTKPKFAPAFLAKLAEVQFAEEYYDLCIGYGFHERTGEKYSGADIVKALKAIGEAHQFPGPGRVFEARLADQPPELRLTFRVYSGGHTLEPTLLIDDGDFKLGGQFCSLAHWINEALGRERHNPPFPRPSFFTLSGLIDCVQKHQALAMRLFQVGRELREANPAVPLVTHVDLREEQNIALARIPPVEIDRAVGLFNRGDVDAIHQYVLELCPNDNHHPTATPDFLFTLLAREFTSMSLEQLRALHDKIERRHCRRDLIMAAVELLLAQNNVSAAQELTDLIHEDMAYQGQRTMLRYFAKAGDLKAYQATLKRSDRRKHKSELKQIEAQMAESYSAKEGIEAALTAFGSENPYLVFLILKAQTGRLNYDELSAASSRLLEPLDRHLHGSLHVHLLAADARCGMNVAGQVRRLLDSVAQIDPKERSYGNVGTRQELLHQLGKTLLEHNQTETMDEVLRLMSRSSHKTDIQREMKQRSLKIVQSNR